ncbi:rhamnogalacturonan lyase B N-terminal domain-containing protein [Roseateles sp. DXS20W]|uniref:rhamnogalacturonan endolyase n=1 Tax=Pelomonas lactea TaxID=3299030 RepID=A0ABW7GM07_9BURK
MNPLPRARPAALSLAAAASTLFASAPALAAFGVTDAGGVLTVDSGAGLVFKVSKTNGDITSMKLNGGAELLGQTKGSHISSGLSAMPGYSVSGSTALITIPTSTLTHYLAVRSGENIVYMATHITAEPSVGELRWITRLNRSVFTGVPTESNHTGNTGAIESTDVVAMSDGTTRSKYYGNQRAKDLTLRGVTGSGVGVFMAYGNRESSSGGPFFRDIQFKTDTDVEVTNYMNSGHNQTEAFRMGLHGPYAMVVTTGATPAVPDMGWMSSLGLNGWVASGSRGKVVLNGLTGMDTAFTYTVGFANGTAQYWGTASSSGAASVAGMKPGSYTMTVYKGELAVHSEPVTVGSGGTTTLNTRAITADPSSQPVLWRVGQWDGTPLEFLNGQTLNVRHPSDSRNPSWGPVTYAVGSATNKFPGAIWKGVNGDTKITFNLTSAQLAARTVRVGISAAYANARPQISVNGWTSSVPAASTQPDSRSLTIGTYRGNNTVFTFSVPASAFVAGANTLTINVASGSGSTAYLSPGFAVDAIDLY